MSGLATSRRSTSTSSGEAHRRQCGAREATQAADSCKQPKPGLANLPIEDRGRGNPTDAQQAELNRLEEATSKAVEIMQAACPG